ncbi:MAG TPA: hypothetical protein VE993_14450 [Stellaceae bacterium]|nr:hypothetical protein [Stellaceae bacterium]
MSEMKKRITAEVRRILLGDWDPIGIRDLPEKYRRAATDEYDSYIGAIIGMLSADRSQQEIANFLYDTEIRDMGGRRDRAAADAAAAKLVYLRALMASGK